MEHSYETKPDHQSFADGEEGLSVSMVFAGFRARWKLFVVGVLAAWLIAGTYILITPSQYAADTEFIYSERSFDGPQPTGLAAIASSVGLGRSSTSSRDVALAVLKSRQVAADFVEKYNLLPLLFADSWDADKKAWKVVPSKVPTPMDGALRWASIMTVSDNADLGVITLSVRSEHQKLVAQLANNYVKMADDVLRQRALADSQQSLKYLEQQLGKTNMTELRISITRLMEEALQRMTLTSTRHDYAFNVIDRAIPPKQRVWPRKGMLLGVFTILALLAAASISATIDLRKKGYLP